MQVATKMSDIWHQRKFWPAEVVAELEALMTLSRDNANQSDSAHHPEVNFENYFGGNFYLVETVEDLDQIITSEESSLPTPVEGSGGWASIREKPCTFEWMHYLPSKDFIMIFNVTNNNGGPTYYVPRSVFEQCQNVEDSLIMSTPDESDRVHSREEELR